MEITHKHIEKKFAYDGSQINPSWAFKTFGVKGSSIITWRGAMNITPDNMKDFADVRRKKWHVHQQKETCQRCGPHQRPMPLSARHNKKQYRVNNHRGGYG